MLGVISPALSLHPLLWWQYLTSHRRGREHVPVTYATGLVILALSLSSCAQVTFKPHKPRSAHVRPLHTCTTSLAYALYNMKAAAETHPQLSTWLYSPRHLQNSPSDDRGGGMLRCRLSRQRTISLSRLLTLPIQNTHYSHSRYSSGGPELYWALVIKKKTQTIKNTLLLLSHHNLV